MQSSLFADFPEVDKAKPLVLLLGNVDHEGITSSLKSSGDQYKKKLLDSKAENWQTIVEYFREFTIRAVVIKLNAPVYERLASPEYHPVARELLSHIATSRHMAFVFEDLLSGREQNNEQRDSFVAARAGIDESDDEELRLHRQVFGLYQPDSGVLSAVNELLRSYQLSLVPYRTNAEVTVIATQFLNDALEGLLFRVYVPAGRLWANEVDRLLQLFRDYLLRTGRRGIRLDQVRTDHGVSYEFHGEDAQSSAPLAEDFKDFSTFLDLCLSNPSEAESLLKRKDIDPREIAEILTRYSKEAKRLQLDLRQDRERKILNIRHRLESELVDALPSDAQWATIEKLVRDSLPAAFGVAAAYFIDQGPVRMLPSAEGAQYTINLNPQIVHTVNGVVAREIRGDVTTSEDDQRLLDAILQHAGAEAVELASAVQELSDGAIPKPTRLARAQKLKGFVLGLGPRLGPIATSVLTAYIEKKLGLN